MQTCNCPAAKHMVSLRGASPADTCAIVSLSPVSYTVEMPSEGNKKCQEVEPGTLRHATFPQLGNTGAINLLQGERTIWMVAVVPEGGKIKEWGGQ